MFVKKFRKVVKIISVSFAVLSAITACIACDIGLGGAVDTEAPTGSITSPGDDAVIRDAFAIKGSWHDDGSVGKITVNFRNTKTNSINTYNADVSSDGTWLCVVNPSDSNQSLLDGNYVATVTLYDNGGHTNTLTRSYTIDNTAPVVILSYLKSKDDSETEIKTYGKLFTLSGKAADDNNINRIDVKVYQDEGCNTELRTISKLNVPAAIEQDVATFGTEEYAAIYGENSTSSQIRYCKIFAYDDAQRYPVDGSAQSDSDKLGNCQTSYYFQTTIEKLGYDKYKTNDLYAMFNGTYSIPTADSSRAVLSADEIAAVKKALSDTAVTIGTFALNPENSPTYRVIGLNKVLSKSESMEKEGEALYPINEAVAAYILTNGTSDTGTPLTINITPGRDNYAIETSTVTAYFQECDKYGNVVYKDDNGNGKYVVKDKDGNIKTDASGNYIDENGISITYVEPLKETEKIIIGAGSSSITSNAVSTLTYSGLETSHCYKVIVDGYDTQGNKILPSFDANGNSQIYAFYLEPLNGVIELSVSGAPWGQNVEDFEALTNYISSATEKEDYKKFKVQLNYSYTGEQRLDAYKKEADGSFTPINNNSELDKGPDQTYPILIDAESLASDAVTYTYKLQNADNTSYSRERSITIYRDNTYPEVKTLVIPATRDTSNSFFQFSGTAEDPVSSDNVKGSGIAEVWVTLYQTKIENGQEVEDTAKSVTVKATGTESWYLQINKNNTEDYSKYQTLLAEEGKKKIKVKVIDKVGLVKESEPQDWTYKPTKPVFEIKSYTPEAAGASEINLNNSYSFNTGAKFTLNGSASDNYGIEDIIVTQTKTNGSISDQTLSIKNSKITYNESSKEWSISGLPIIPDGTTAKKAIGKYEYTFTVKDKALIDTEVSDVLKIVYDNEPPAISKVHADVDITNASENTKDSEGNTKWYKNLTQYIKVSASDGDGSGIASVEWCTLKAGVDPDSSTEWQPLTIKTELVNGEVVTTYNGSVVFTDDAAGNKLYIRATDNVGNVTKFKTKKTENSTSTGIEYIVFNIDTSAPILKAAYYEIEGIAGLKNPVGTVYLNGSKTITVYGQYSDVHSGVKDLDLSLGNTTFTKYYSEKDLTYNTDEQGNNISVKNPASDWATSIANADKIKSWKVEFTPSINENETVDFNLTGENNAGGKTEIKPLFSVIKDTKEPTIVRKNVTFTYSNTETKDDVVYMKGEKGESDEKYYVNNTRDKFTLKGIATDNIALDTIELKAKDKDGNYVTISSTKSGSASTWTFSDIDLSSLSEKATLCVELTDLAGNKNDKNEEANQKFLVIFDTTPPKGVHLQDGKGKDIYFRIGNNKNDDNANVSEGEGKYNSALDDDVGSKYSAETYGNATNLEIRGLFDDGNIFDTKDVSGLKTIYYKVYKKSEYTAAFDKVTGKTYKQLIEAEANSTLAENIKKSPTGIITPESNPVEKRVFYTDSTKTSVGPTLDGKLTSEGYIKDKDGNFKHWAKIKSNYDQRITGFEEKNNYLVLVAEDNVENIAVDVVLLNEDENGVGDSYNNFSLNVDIKAPTVSSDQSSLTNLYSNATTGDQSTKVNNGDIVLTGTVKDTLSDNTLSDNVSELKSLIIKIGDTNNKIEFKIKEEENVTNYYVDNVKQTNVPAADADFTSEAYKDKTNILTTNKNASNELAVRKWKATIPGTYFAGLSGNVVISAIAKDNAGNEETVTVANVIVDSVAPAVNLNLAENTTVNGKQTLKGTISDSYLTEDPAGVSEPGTLELFYTIKDGTTTAPASIDSATAATADASTAWRKYGTIKHASSFEFKDIDTSKLILSGGTDSTTYIPDQTKVFFTVKATDKAGNIGFSDPKSFTVDQDTDRPVITFQNLTLSNAVKNGNTTTYSPMGKKTETKDESIWALSRQIYVSVSDDDGVESVSIMLKDDDTSTPDKDDAGWKSMDYTGVIWQYEIPADGYKVIYFKVVDKASPNGVFISKSSTSLDIKTPKICDTSKNYYGYRTGNGVTAGNKNIFASTVYAKIDTTNPTIPYIYYTTDSAVADSITSTSSMTFGTTIPAGWKDISELTGYFGGTASQKLYVLYASQDDNGIISCEDKILKDTEELNAIQKVFEPTTDNKLCGRLVEFDISSLSSGANTLKLKVIDRSGREFEKEKTINIDNNAPIIEDLKLDEGETVYGGLNVQFRGKARDEQKQTVSKVFFAVTNNTNPPAKDEYTDISKYISVGSGNWDISFDGKEDLNDEDNKDTATAYHAKLLNDYLDDYYDTINGKKPSEREDTLNLYIWLYAEDSLGNSGYKLDSNNNYDAANSAVENRLLKVLPLADKPDVTIEYPTSGSTVGGTVRITGSTEIKADKVAGVYFQVDPNFNGTFCNDSSDDNYWYKKLTELESEFNNGKADDEKVHYDFADIEGIGKVIQQTSGSVMNWTFVVNTKGEFAPINNVNRSVAVRAYAVSDERKIISDYKDINFTVDPKRPVFGSDFILEQRDDSGNVLKKMKYVENTWLSGVWHLTGSVSHTSGIKTLEIRDSQNEPVTLTHGTDKTTFDITVGKTSGSGKSIFKIYAEAKTTNTTQDNDFEVKLQYDNEAPSNFLPETSEISSLAANGNLFKQYNGTFQLSGKITDADSGLKRIAFYFTRTVDGTEYFIDPMITKVSSAANAVAPALYRNNYVPTSELISAVETGLTSTDGLLWRKVTGASVANTNELTISAVPNNVRVGSICKINNVIYRINAVSGTKLTLDGSLADATGLSVYFALAQIIDNTSTEVGSTDVYQNSSDTTVISNGDGDWMQEGIKPPIGNVYNWQASINSKNIYDGPVTLHFVYYDEAGNFASKTYDGKFCNNAPRIASITVATDYDGNGIAGNLDTEKDTYYVLGDRITNLKNAVSNLFNKTEVKVTDRNNESKSFMTLKGRSKFDVEIIGGNGKLWYSYSIGSSNDWDTNTIKGECATSLGDGNQDNDGRSGVSDSAAAYSEDSHIKTIDIPESYFSNYLNKKQEGDAQNTYYINNSSKDSPTWFCYKIWDETDGYTKFSTSQYVTMRVALAVDVHDSQAPSVVISPFKWISADENSLYENSSSNGHIELSGDWTDSDYYKNLASKPDSGEYDADPKVSGKIVFRGSAWDNILLKELWAKISWGTGEDAKNFGFTKALDGENTSLTGYKRIAVYEKKGGSGDDKDTMVWKIPEADVSDGWKFSIDQNDDKTYKGELGSDGHTVYWTFVIDTEKLYTDILCASDVTVSILAVDSKNSLISPAAGSGSSSLSQVADINNNKTSYRMDVVPYITGVSTSLSSLKNNNPSVYNRSAQGHYPVKSDETVTLSGFNLGANTSLNISNLSTSGAYEITVNDIKSLNNLNNNNGKGSYNKTVDLATNPTGVYSTYANYYNRQPNNDNNNLLTDDIYFDVWQFKDAGISQSSGYITEPIMKVNPKNGMLNFGFNSGPANYCMANGQDTSYTTWVGNYARFSTCGFAVDENGNTHGITVGLDTNPGNNTSAGRMTYLTSKWGTSYLGTDGNYQGWNSSRIENIGAPKGTYNGVTFDSGVFIEDKLASPSLATIVRGDNTYVFLAYYDDLNAEIRFKWGNLATATNSYTGAADDKTYGGKKIGYCFDQFQDQMSYGLDWNAHTVFDVNKKNQYFSTIAGPSMTAKAGNYVSIDVVKGTSISTDVVVATWYDATANKWWYSYKKKPYSDNDMSSTTGDEYWSTPFMLKSNAGENCQIAVDKVGGIHIASYDSSRADLVYAYLSSYADTSPQVVTVDAYAFTGTNIRLDTIVSDDGKYIIPYIGYYMSSTQKTKMAYLPGVISADAAVATRELINIPNGVDSSEAVTATWESSIIPSTSRYADNYAYSYVNVGLWKDADTGKAKPMTGTDVKYSDITGLSKTNTSKTFGNGTKNPVVAYATRVGTRGHLETAQMK